MLNTFEETFEVTEMRTFKHEPFFIVGGGGGGAYSWYFTVYSFYIHNYNHSINYILTRKRKSCGVRPWSRAGLSLHTKATNCSRSTLVEPSADNSIRCTPICLYVLCAPTYSKPREWLPLNSSQFDWVLSGSQSWRSSSVNVNRSSLYSRPLAGGIAQYIKRTVNFCDSHALANVDPADSYSSLCSFKTSKISFHTSHFPNV